MPILQDFEISSLEDTPLVISMAPQVPIGGWDIRFECSKRFGVTSGFLIEKNVKSGYSGVSGITITNSGTGVFQVFISSQNTSGLEYGNYSYTLTRYDSGARTILVEGYLQLTP